jgi:hypothetical protein
MFCLTFDDVDRLSETDDTLLRACAVAQMSAANKPPFSVSGEAVVRVSMACGSLLRGTCDSAVFPMCMCTCVLHRLSQNFSLRPRCSYPGATSLSPYSHCSTLPSLFSVSACNRVRSPRRRRGGRLCGRTSPLFLRPGAGLTLAVCAQARRRSSGHARGVARVVMPHDTDPRARLNKYRPLFARLTRARAHGSVCAQATTAQQFMVSCIGLSHSLFLFVCSTNSHARAAGLLIRYTPLCLQA